MKIGQSGAPIFASEHSLKKLIPTKLSRLITSSDSFASISLDKCRQYLWSGGQNGYTSFTPF